jgi:hypothetical protein
MTQIMPHLHPIGGLIGNPASAICQPERTGHISSIWSVHWLNISTIHNFSYIDSNRTEGTALARSASFVETTCRSSGSLLNCGQRAEIVRLYAKDRIELAAKVFQRDHRS